MIDRAHDLPVKRQAELLGISRGTVYYHPEPITTAERAPMRQIDELHLEHLFAGSRMLRVEALRDAAARWGAPEIVNTDQGSQFSGAEFVTEVKRIGARQSMDGRGCWRDNVFVERLWKSVKYEEVYLKAYDSVGAARAALARCLAFYNTRRPHQSHEGRTPDMVYIGSLTPLAAAA